MNDSKRVLIYGRSGGFGQLFARRLEGIGYQVNGVDTKENPATNCLSVDQIDQVSEAVTHADIVLLCIPEETVLDILPGIAKLALPKTLFVDIASVKSRIAGLAERTANETGIEYLSIHPMFGPSVNFVGGNLIAIPITGGIRSENFIEVLKSWQVHLHRMTASEHDAATRVTQIACHAAVLAYARAAESSGLDFNTIQKVETPISRALMAMSARVLEGDPELYYSIQQNQGESSRTRVCDALSEFNDQMNNEDLVGWCHTMNDIKRWCGSELQRYVEIASNMLSLNVPGD